VSENEKKLDLQADLGMSRRDLLRRGAVVGGALLWVAPAIQSLTPPAYANNFSTQSTTCCACVQVKKKVRPACASDHFTPDSCRAFCASQGSTMADFQTGNTTCSPKGTCVDITA
jgi:hypothetical protein